MFTFNILNLWFSTPAIISAVITGSWQLAFYQVSVMPFILSIAFTIAYVGYAVSEFDYILNDSNDENIADVQLCAFDVEIMD
jgi:uncharacterized membrane protein (DUF485 family)